VGGDILDYSGELTTSTADITTFKILTNSTLSTKDAEMMMMDINKYYVGMPLPRYEYMCMLLLRFTEEIMNKYNLRAMAVIGWFFLNKQASWPINFYKNAWRLWGTIPFYTVLDCGCTKKDQYNFHLLWTILP
jgi:hypothetical protein